MHHNSMESFLTCKQGNRASESNTANVNPAIRASCNVRDHSIVLGLWAITMNLTKGIKNKDDNGKDKGKDTNTPGQTDRQTDRQIGTQIDRETERHTYTHTHIYIYIYD